MFNSLDSDVRKPDFVVSEQQQRRPACMAAQSYQSPCFLSLQNI